jgi:hypothetical protein
VRWEPVFGIVRLGRGRRVMLRVVVGGQASPVITIIKGLSETILDFSRYVVLHMDVVHGM